MTAASTTAVPSPSTAVPLCSQPHGDERNPGSNWMNVSGSNPIAMVIVWYGWTFSAAATTAPSASAIGQVWAEPWWPT